MLFALSPSAPGNQAEAPLPSTSAGHTCLGLVPTTHLLPHLAVVLLSFPRGPSEQQCLNCCLLPMPHGRCPSCSVLPLGGQCTSASGQTPGLPGELLVEPPPKGTICMLDLYYMEFEFYRQSFLGVILFASSICLWIVAN